MVSESVGVIPTLLRDQLRWRRNGSIKRTVRLRPSDNQRSSLATTGHYWPLAVTTDHYWSLVVSRPPLRLCSGRQGRLATSSVRYKYDWQCRRDGQAGTDPRSGFSLETGSSSSGGRSRRWVTATSRHRGHSQRSGVPMMPGWMWIRQNIATPLYHSINQSVTAKVLTRGRTEHFNLMSFARGHQQKHSLWL